MSQYDKYLKNNVSQKYLCLKKPTYLCNLFVLSEHRMYRVVQKKRPLYFQFTLYLFYLCTECTGWYRDCGTARSREHVCLQGPQESGGVGGRYTGVLWGGLHPLCLRSAYLFLIVSQVSLMFLIVSQVSLPVPNSSLNH